MKVVTIAAAALVVAVQAAALQFFDASLQRLPAHFKGSSISDAFKTYSTAPRGEFETTAEHDRRVESLPVGILAFLPERISVNYDADAQQFSIQEDTSAIKESSGFTVKRTRIGTREYYVGQNAFGVKKLIRKDLVRVHGVSTDAQTQRVFRIAVPRERAPAMKPRLRLLILVRTGPESPRPRAEEAADLSSEFRQATDVEYEKPTIDSPIERATLYFAFDAHLLGFWVFDDGTGKILGKFDAKGDPTHDTPQQKELSSDDFAFSLGLYLGMPGSAVKRVLGEPDYLDRGWVNGVAVTQWVYSAKKLRISLSDTGEKLVRIDKDE
jgi:hypothetical protein